MYKLLIADDENTILEGLSKFIPWDTVGCEVAGVAKDGHEAIEHIKNNPPDIVITDIKMPRKSGIDVARFVSENCPKVKVIVLTGFADFEYARSALGCGVFDYVLKPVSKNKLLESIKKLTARLDEETDCVHTGKGAMAPYIGKLYDIEKYLRDHDYDAGRQSASSLFESLNMLMNQEYHVSPLIEKALRYIQEHYSSTNLSLETIAAHIMVAPSHLSRTFKKETGEVVTDFINRTRIEKAKELLMFTDKLAYEVAEAVGFKDSAYFSLVFKKITGVSPKEFKNGAILRLRGSESGVKEIAPLEIKK